MCKCVNIKKINLFLIIICLLVILVIFIQILKVKNAAVIENHYMNGEKKI